MVGQQQHIGGSAGKWQLDSHVSAYIMIRSGSKTGISTPRLAFRRASISRWLGSIRELQIWIAEHLNTKLSVEDLAGRMSMSVRNFERVFTREVGTTPSQYVLQMRVEAARRELERTRKGFKQVASAVGFSNVDLMRRAFFRLLGLTPRRYREMVEHSSNK